MLKKTIKLFKSKQSYQLVLPLFGLSMLLGYVAPDITKIFELTKEAASSLIGNLLAAFIAIPSMVLAIAAILFAILQLNNRKITITQLIFENSVIIPLTYWTVFNTILLILLQLFSQKIGINYTVQGLSAVTYNLVLLLIGLLYTLYCCFRYLNYTNITDDYIENIYELIRNELIISGKDDDNQQLRQRGKEVYAEVADAINKDDNILLNKYLKTFAFTLNLNPSSNFINDFNSSLAKWIVRAAKLRSRLFGPLIEFWRSQFMYRINTMEKKQFSNIDRIPLVAYKLVEDESELKDIIISSFSLRLKEIAQKSFYTGFKQGDFVGDKDFEELLPVFIEFSELIHYLISRSDIKSLKIILNDIQMMRETFSNGKFLNIKSKITVNRARGNTSYEGLSQTEIDIYEILQKVRLEIDMVILGNLSWIYFKHFNNKLPTERSIVELLQRQLKPSEVLEAMVPLYKSEDKRMYWDEWIWKSEERLSGKAYVIPSIIDLIAAGFAGMLLNDNRINIDKRNVEKLDDLKFLVARTRDFLKKIHSNYSHWEAITQKDEAAILDRINDIYKTMESIDTNIEDDFIRRLANEKISAKKVEEFKQIIANQWEETRDLSKFFEHFSAMEINPEMDLIDAGDNLTFNRGKVMFVDGELYAYIHGLELGKRVNDAIEVRLAEKLSPLTTTSDSNLGDLFEKGIEELIKDGFAPNAILIDMGLFYTNEMELSTTGKYSSIINHSNPYNFPIAGFFNNIIPIIPVSNFAFQDLVVITEMPKGIIMQQRQKEEYFGKNLWIEVNEIDQAQALKLIAKKKENKQLAELNVLELMSSMHIHVHQIFDFKILNARAMKVYLSNLENFGRS